MIKYSLFLGLALTACQCEVKVDSKPIEDVPIVASVDAGTPKKAILSEGWREVTKEDILEEEAKVQAIMRKFTLLEIRTMINDIPLGDKRPESVRNLGLLRTALSRLTADSRKTKANLVNEKLNDL